MATEKIILTVEKLSELLTAKGVSDKRIERLTRSISSVPMEGTFSEVDVDTFTSDGKVIKFPILVITDKKGERIGQISFGSLFQQQATGKARQIRRGENEGKYFHAGANVSELKGSSEAEKIINLIGKSYKAESVSLDVPKLILVDNKPIFYDSEEEAIQAIEAKDCFKFTVKY